MPARPARRPGEPARRRRLAGLPRARARRAHHPSGPVRERRRDRARHDPGSRRPPRLDRPRRVVGADQGPAGLLGAAAARGRGAARRSAGWTTCRRCCRPTCGRASLPAAAGAAPRRAHRVPRGPTGRRPADRRPLADPARSRSPTRTSPAASAASATSIRACRCWASCRRRTPRRSTGTSPPGTRRRSPPRGPGGPRRASRWWTSPRSSRGISPRGRCNPDGMHWGWECHAEVGRAVATAVRDQVDGRATIEA